jgi:hypothetical protein
MPFYEKGDVRIHYEEAGSGFPLLVIPGGGLNSTVAGLATHPFNPFDEFKDDYRVIVGEVVRRAAGLKASTEQVQHVVIRPAGGGSPVRFAQVRGVEVRLLRLTVLLAAA